MTWVGFAAAAITALGALLLALMSAEAPTNRPRRMLVLVVIFVAGVLAAASALVSQQREVRSALQFEREMREQAEVTLAAVTGGDSYCWIDFLRPFTEGTTRLTLAHHGKYPLYDVTARIVDLEASEEAFQGRSHLRYEELSLFQTTIDIGNISPVMDMPILDEWPIGDGDSRAFNVFFAARNGAWFESIRLVRKSGEWLKAIRVYRDDELLQEFIDKGYPLDALDSGG